MRILYLTTLYPAYVRSFYGKRPTLASASYAEQREALDGDGFAWNGAWRGPMAQAGHEFMEIASNADPAQRRWGEEHGIKLPSTGWRHVVAAAQIKAFAPEVLLADDVRNFSATWYHELRRQVPSLRVIIGFLTSPSYDQSTLDACDIVLCLLRRDVDRIRAQGGRAHLFRHAFNSDALPQLGPRPTDSQEISFCGSIIRGAGVHSEREQLLEYLADAGLNLRIYTPEIERSRVADVAETTARRFLFESMRLLQSIGIPETTLRTLPLVGKAATWRDRPSFQYKARLKPLMREAKYGIELLQTMRHSAVTVNIHAGIAGDEAVNVRLFEATGAGTCLLTDQKSNIAELFTPESEIVTFSSPEECVERARWLLDHPIEREAIARAGQERTLREHTLYHRVADIEEAASAVLRSR